MENSRSDPVLDIFNSPVKLRRNTQLMPLMTPTTRPDLTTPNTNIVSQRPDLTTPATNVISQGQRPDLTTPSANNQYQTPNIISPSNSRPMDLITPMPNNSPRLQFQQERILDTAMTRQRSHHSHQSGQSQPNDDMMESPLKIATGSQGSAYDARSSGSKPGTLPPLPDEQIEQMLKFKYMAYDKEYVLNIDNRTTNRRNDEYVSGYYKKLSEYAVIAKQDALSKESISPRKSFKTRANSVAVPNATELKLNLAKRKGSLNQQQSNEMHDQSLQMMMPDGFLNSQSQQLPQPLSSRNAMHKRLQSLPAVRNPIIQSLNENMSSEAQFKALDVVHNSHKQRARKDLTMQLIGLQEYQAPDETKKNQLPFSIKGQIEKDNPINADDLSSGQELEEEPADSVNNQDIKSDVYRVMEDNYDDYMRELQQEEDNQRATMAKVRSKLPPGERMQFDQDEEFARNTIITAKQNQDEYNSDDGIGESKEPERDFEKLKARIKLKAIKKFTEDENHRKVKEQRLREAEAMGINRPTSAERKRKKHEPIKRRRSFTEIQIKFEENLQLYSAEKDQNQKQSLTDKATIQRMMQAKRFPIPEALMNRPDSYWLKIDSIVHSVYNYDILGEIGQEPLQMRAPKNSDVSEDNFSFGQTTDEEAEEKLKKGEDPNAEPAYVFDQSLIELMPWDLDKLNVFPHKARDGEPPVKMLRKPNEPEYLVEAASAIAKMQEDPKGVYSHETLQRIFDFLCGAFRIPPFPILKYFQPADNDLKKFSVKGLVMTEQITKCFACLIPFIPEIHEVEFQKNNITDIMSTVLLFGCFMNPNVKRFAFIMNPVRTNFNKSFQLVNKLDPKKFTEINFQMSVNQVEQMESMTKAFTQTLVKLNLSGIPLGMNATRVLNLFLLKQQNIKDLNLARCSLNNQSARYIVDALVRNLTIRHLNISYNDFGSTIYEFGIKIAQIMTRHPTLLHAQYDQCNLTKQETMFIIIAMSTSKSFLSMHISGNDLPYYERIFLRALIAARVQYNSKYEMGKADVKLNKDRNQVVQLASREHLDPELHRYITNFNKLEEQREGLDFEMADLIKEIDLEKHFTKDKPALKLADLKPEDKLAILIAKIRERAGEVKQNADRLEAMSKMTIEERKEYTEMLEENAREQADASPKAELNAKGSQSSLVPAGDKKSPFKSREGKKEKKERSAGELALLFMGINQVAFDLLIENPMTGYMNEVIFTRILGSDDIEQGNYWADTTLCYICQRWEKISIAYDTRVDVSAWTLKIVQINNLKKTIESLNNEAADIEEIEASKVRAILEEEQRLERERRLALELSDDEDAAPSKNEKNKMQKSLFKDDSNKPKKKEIIRLKPKGISVNTGQIKKLGPQVVTPKYGGASGLTLQKPIKVKKELPAEEPKPEVTSPQGVFASTKRSGRSHRSVSPRATAKSIKSVNQSPPRKTEKSVKYDSPSRKSESPTRRSEKAVAPTHDEMTAIEEARHRIKHDNVGTPEEKATRPNRQPVNHENPITPQAVEIKGVQQHVFPEQFVNANDFEEMVNSRPNSAADGAIGQGQHDQYINAKGLSRYGGPPGGMPGGILKKQPKKQTSMKDLTQFAVTSQADHYERAKSPALSVAPSQITTSIINPNQQRIRGQPQKIQRTLFFGGLVYVIEEEVFSDSDNSSVYTSEDDFEDDQQMVGHYIQEMGKYDQKMADLAEEARIAALNPKKTERELRLERLGIVDETKIPLTDGQKEYRTKLWPKFYVPSVKEYKSEQLDEVGRQLELKIGGVKEGKRTLEDRGPAISSGPLQNKIQVYLMASFNDWMPFRLKTKRDLTFEKLNPEEPIPKATFVLDNYIFLFANYVPPGSHFFYFVKESGTIVLSPNYPIVRFKSTNIFLNKLTVKARIMDFDAVNIVKGGDDDEIVFIKDRSIFKDFRDDNKAYLKKCFDQDVIYTKISRTVKGEEEQLQDLHEILLKNYQKLINIHLYYIGISSYPTIGLNDFTSWAKGCNLVDGKWIDLAALDRILITTNVALHGLISSAERDLNRYEFLEILVRLGNALYRDSKVCPSAPAALVKLLSDNIFPNSKDVNGENFRRFQCYNVKVNDILQKNEVIIRKVYDQYTHAKKKFVTLAECREFVLKCQPQLDVSQMQVGVLFAESMMTIIDTIIDQKRPDQMKFTEFVVFLCRIAFEHYRGSHYENEMMYLKIEKLLPRYLSVIHAEPLFLYNEEFEYKPMVKKSKKKKKQSRKKDSSDDSDDSDTDKEEEEEEESSSEDDLGECIVLEEGKFKLALNFIQKMEREKIERAERRAKRAEVAAEKAEKKRKEAEEKKRKKKELRALGGGGKISSDEDDDY